MKAQSQYYRRKSISHLLSTQIPGFTLIELLVVVGILVMLSSLFLAVVARARDKVHTAVCMNNLKQLQNCWHLYALDNNDVLPPNNSIYVVGASPNYISNASWCLGIATKDTTFDNVKGGMLFAYNTSVGIYHCPADRSKVEGASQLRTRSYNMSQSVNGYPEFDTNLCAWLPSYKRFSQIITPSPSGLFVFLDVHEDAILDSLFGIPTQISGGQGKWWDVPANRHNQGCVFSFADGHVERWKWDVPKIVRRKPPRPLAAGELGDYKLVQSATRQNFD